MGKDEFGLFSAAFHPLGAEGFEGFRRPASMSLVEGLTASQAVREGSGMEEGTEGEGNGDGVDGGDAPTVSLASRRRPGFTVVHPAPEDFENGSARAVEGKTEEV